MIGLMFFGAIGLWGIIAIALSLWASKLAGEKWRWLAAIVLMPLVFFAPVADEIVAYPQMQVLCAQSGKTRLIVSEAAAQGLSVYYYDELVPANLWPSSVRIIKHESGYKNAITNEAVLLSSRIYPVSGFLAVPAGSGGGTMPVILKACVASGDDLARQPSGLVKKFKWIEVDRPKTK
jgi:hypothetical protein